MNDEHTDRSKTGFGSFGIHADVLRGIAAAGFNRPRPIQSRTIPAALEGRDILGLAQTGTGKTAAFLLPILTRLMGERRSGPRALVIAPTRELANQIRADGESLARFTPLRFVSIFGGVAAGPQIRALGSHADVVVACPGRLLDLWQRRDVDLSRIESLVLDEADQLFDMGFLPDIRRIIAALPRKRQNLLFAATMPREIRSLSGRLLYEPHVAEVDHSTPAATVEHALFDVEREHKLDLLQRLISADDFTSAMVFLRTKHRARRLAQQLVRAGHRAVGLQGNMSQPQRDRAMNGFRDGRFNVLVATDIAARGIDVAKVSHVINFDVPGTPDAYTHRIGRTGRAERSGRAYTFVCREDRGAVRDIENRFGMRIPRLDPAGLDGSPRKRRVQSTGHEADSVRQDALPRPAPRPKRGGRPRASGNSRTRRPSRRRTGPASS